MTNSFAPRLYRDDNRRGINTRVTDCVRDRVAGVVGGDSGGRIVDISMQKSVLGELPFVDNNGVKLYAACPPCGVHWSAPFDSSPCAAALVNRPKFGEPSPLTTRTNIGLVTIVVLVALRVGIGWHFYKEGTNKLKDGDFDAAPVVRQAKGEFAPYYKNMAPDDDAMMQFVRDHYNSEMDTIDADKAVKESVNQWWLHRERVGDYYQFGDQPLQQRLKDQRSAIKKELEQLRKPRDESYGRIERKRALEAIPADERSEEEQATLAALTASYPADVDAYEAANQKFLSLEEQYKQLERDVLTVRYQHELADEIIRHWGPELVAHLEAHEAEFVEYFKAVERRDRYQEDASRREVESLDGQLAKIEAEVKKQRGPLVAPLKIMWESVGNDLNSLAIQEQRDAAGLPPEIPKPTDVSWQIEVANNVVPWFDTIVGVLLVLGLFTRLAAIAAALLLLSVVSMQLPWADGAVPTYYQWVELLALLAVAATGAGRFAGLDFFLRCAYFKVFRPREETVEQIENSSEFTTVYAPVNIASTAPVVAAEIESDDALDPMITPELVPDPELEPLEEIHNESNA